MKRGSVVIVCLILVSILSISAVSASLLTDIGDFFQNLFNIGDDEDLGGELAARPTSCTDSDGGLAYTIYGTCADSLKKINDSCVVGGTYNGQLAESYCQQK
ncbi:MAG: hypothetical protein Q8N63_00565, partial [Nanoarchaeota archaeon]|nr:hypothetical protein [Nanoarchaeota archaeon]